MADGDRDSRSGLLVREIFIAGFMAGLPPENIAWAAPRLARNMEDVLLHAGDVLYRQGDPTNGHYFVVYGEIELAADGVPPWRLDDRSLVGTIDLTLDRPRSRTATATRDSHLLFMPAADWLDMQEDNFELTLRAVEGLSFGVHQLRLGISDFDTGLAKPPAYPAPPQRPLDLLERVSLLRAIPLFSAGEVQALINLAEHAEEESHPDEKVLLPRHDPSEALFVVLSGEVTAVHADLARIERFGGGALVLGGRAATSKDLGVELRVSGEGTRLLRIGREDYFDAMEEHFGLSRSAIRVLATEREAMVNEKVRTTKNSQLSGDSSVIRTDRPPSTPPRTVR